jgi:hypothetical protein
LGSDLFQQVLEGGPIERRAGEGAIIEAVGNDPPAEGGSIAFAKVLAARGCSAIHVSSGDMTPAQKIPVGPSYQDAYLNQISFQVPFVVSRPRDFP